MKIYQCSGRLLVYIQFLYSNEGPRFESTPNYTFFVCLFFFSFFECDCFELNINKNKSEGVLSV